MDRREAPLVKRYVMTRHGGAILVTVREGNVSVRPLPHLVRHSPDSFEWGYGGSGPADLARSIVGDFIDDQDPDPALYQAVKCKLVAAVPWAGGEITEDQLLEVLRGVS